MCGRFRVSRSEKEIFAKKWGIRIVDVPDYVDEIRKMEMRECPPGSMQDVVRVTDGEREFTSMRWGFNMTIQGKKTTVFNSKAEGVEANRLWKSRLQNRCIVPAACFIEWPHKAKTEISIKDQEMIGMAALWGMWTHPKTNEVEPTFSIFTTEPNGVMQHIHRRQPVILNPSEYEEWIQPADRPPLHLLRIFPDEVTVVTPVVD